MSMDSLSRPMRSVAVAVIVSLAVAAHAAGPSPDTPDPGTAIAAIDGKTIAYSDLLPSLQERLDAMQRQYEAQMTELSLNAARTHAQFIESQASNLLDNRLLKMEADSRKTTPAALMGSLKAGQVTAAEMRAFYDAEQDRIGKPYEEVAAQIKTYLQERADEHARRAFFDSLRAKYRGRLLLEPRRELVEASGPQRGPDGAPVTIVEFSDFQCPFCARLEPVLAQVEKTYGNRVRLVFRNMPLTALHPNAQNAAAAGVCADQQGKFWEMHDTLFAEQGSLGLAALKEKAKRLALDTAAFDDCMDSGRANAKIQADQEAARQLGLSSTPASFVNGRFVNGAVSFDELSAIIRDELDRTVVSSKR